MLQDAERDAKERYVAPLVGRIRPYLEALFPGSDLEVDEEFRITAVTRSQRRRAVRPSERGHPRADRHPRPGSLSPSCLRTRDAPRSWSWTMPWCSPTISGSSRCSRSWPALRAKLQIIVLTCRERVFQGLAAHRLRWSRRRPWESSDGRSAPPDRDRAPRARRRDPALGGRADRASRSSPRRQVRGAEPEPSGRDGDRPRRSSTLSIWWRPASR